MNFSKRSLTLYVFTLLISVSTYGQLLDSTYWRGYYQTPEDVVNVTRWSERDWCVAGGIVSAGLLVYAYDDQIRDQFQSWRSPTTEAVSKYVAEPIGSGYYSVGGSALALGIGYWTKDEKLKRTSVQAIKAYIITGGATFVLKQLTHRARPYEAGRSDLWYGPYALTGNYDGFPSGHTSVAFAVASVYAHSYREKPWLGVALYSAASLTALSRIHDDKHWASDTFFGAALGWYIGRTIVKTDPRLTLLPTTSGVYFSWSLDG